MLVIRDSPGMASSHLLRDFFRYSAIASSSITLQKSNFIASLDIRFRISDTTLPQRYAARQVRAIRRNPPINFVFAELDL